MDCFSQYQKLYANETKRLILVILVLVSSVLLCLYSPLPYGNLVVSSIKSGFDHSPIVDSSNLTDHSVLLGVVNNTDGETKSRQEGETDMMNDQYVDNDRRSNFKSYSKKPVALTKNSPVKILDHDQVPVAEKSETSDPEDGNKSSSGNFTSTKTISVGKDTIKIQPQVRHVSTIETSSMTIDSVKGQRGFPPTSLSDMTTLLLRNRASPRAVISKWSSEGDRELLYAKSQIESAPIVKSDQELYSPLYRNLSKFTRSYELMENMLKVYIYDEGEKPIFHYPKLKGIYASEGWFMKQMEGNKHYVMKDHTKAHIFYLPFSSFMLRSTLDGKPQHHKILTEFLKKYVDIIAGKYKFWNRTGGADHFLVACHDWAPQETVKYMSNCIRALCNANVATGFIIGKDVSLPETNVRFENDPLRGLGGKPSTKRPYLAFFAGNMHGHIRQILLQHWEKKDPDMKIFGPLPRDGRPSYTQYMKNSKYCICARGYEVHTPRVVEAIFHECVPVIISDNYVPPFFEVLNWEAFSVFIMEKDIPNLKNLLLSIPLKRYLELQKRVKKVQKHFLWHKTPVRHDIFHMTLHSIWYNRVFQMNPN